MVMQMAADAERIILCTPTENHFQYLQNLIPLQKPILCEKPITKKLSELEKVLSTVENHKTPFSMTFQYSELVNPLSEGPSLYRFFRSGKDGLVWDCLQIIGLAKGEIQLSNDSPVWRCVLNGTELNLGQMDFAYLNFVRKWTEGRIYQSPEMLFKIHEKTERMHHELGLQSN